MDKSLPQVISKAKKPLKYAIFQSLKLFELAELNPFLNFFV